MSLPDLVALGTMHGKEAAIAPALRGIGMSLSVPVGLDTDKFGTFTGELSRAGSMLDAARAKARIACEMTGLECGIGSEGSFGPNPALPIIPLGREILVFWDKRHGREIVQQVVDPEPCFASRTVAHSSELAQMLDMVEFPRTSLIVSPAGRDDMPIKFIKGVRSTSELEAAIAWAVGTSVDEQALIQTDMRAHHNPRRMQTIARAASQLAARLACNCPQCGAYGWGSLGVERGLGCSSCGEPTDLVQYELHGCTACEAVEHRSRADGMLEADPRYCQHCNP